MCNILYLSPSTFITENNPNSFPIMKLLDNMTVFPTLWMCYAKYGYTYNLVKIFIQNPKLVRQSWSQ